MFLASMIHLVGAVVTIIVLVVLMARNKGRSDAEAA
jgi:predicted membrane channel-forming protein YqfA (hemolysin III family)